MRHTANPYAVEQRLLEGSDVVADQPGSMANFNHLLAIAQLPGIAGTGAFPFDTGQLAQLQWKLRQHMACQQLRAPHQHLRAAGQWLHHQVAVLQRQKGQAQGEVEALTDHIDFAVEGFDIEFDPRVLAHEAGQHRRQGEIQQQRGATDADRPAGFGAVALHHTLRRLHLGHHRLAMAIVVLADFSDLEIAGRTLDQTKAQALFQAANLAADGRLGHAQLASGSGKATLLDYLQVHEQLIQINHAWTLDRSINGT
ncbi:hypothetical protein D9M71_482980 [compost metagenome]